MDTLHVRLFGGMHLWWERSEEPIIIPPSAQSLLAYLLLHRSRCHTRDALVDLFWTEAEPEQARRCLSTALWRLRSHLEPDGIERGAYLVTTDGGEIGFNQASNYWLDAACFEAALTEVLTRPEAAVADQVEQLETALSLYVGDLLEGWYMDWAILERERFRLMYLKGLRRLMRCHKQLGNYEAGIACAQAILQQDPLREEIHRDLMRLYVANGQRALAVRQYHACQEVLAQELDIPPMVETQMLYAQIRTADADQPAAPNKPSGSAWEEALHNLEVAQRQFAEASQRLEQALDLFRALQAPDQVADPTPARARNRNGRS